MKPSYIPEWMTYTPADIVERNGYLDAFCAKVEPRARQAFEAAVARQTEAENARALIDEANSKELSELQDHKTEDAWIQHRSKDLARAVVGFWVNLGDDRPSRCRGSSVLLDDIIAGRDSKRSRDFETIYSRFWLDPEEARQLLAYVETLGSSSAFGALA